LPLATWLRLLRTRNLTGLETITQIMLRHVLAERLNLQQMVELASAEPIAVARVGFRFLQTRKIETGTGGAADRETIAQLGDARSDRIGAEIAAWALRIVGAKEVYDVENVVRFFDSLQPS